VTGGARGIGKAIARRLADAGFVVIVADVVDDVPGVEPLDVRDIASVRATVERIDAAEPLALVVANAGVALRKPLVDVEPDEYDNLMAINVRGVFFVVQAALHAMSSRRAGSIVTICSTSSFTASTGPMAAYDASKAAVKLLTQAAAREAAPLGIRVNGVAPGTVETSLTRGLASSDELQALARTHVPLGRLGRAEEIADAVAFLASDAASYVTGHVLAVDGGWLA